MNDEEIAENVRKLIEAIDMVNDGLTDDIDSIKQLLQRIADALDWWTRMQGRSFPEER